MSSQLPLTTEQRRALSVALEEFPLASRKQGLKLVGQSRVSSIELDDDAPLDHAAFHGEIEGDDGIHGPEWFYSPSSGWDHYCTCQKCGDCAHAYAAAMAALGAGPAAAPRTVSPPPAEPAAPAEEQGLITLLEERHGRRLERSELASVRALTALWREQRQRCRITRSDLANLRLPAYQNSLYDFQPAIADWWGRGDAPASPLEFWQYLACLHEKEGQPLPTLYRPITDAAAARNRLAALERRRSIENWKRLFAETPPVGEAERPRPSLPYEIRLRLAPKQLLWECRPTPEAGWEAVKPATAAQWFDALQANALGAEPASLALLQEVQLGRMRQTYWSGTEPQTLKLTEQRTLELLHRLLRQPPLRHLLVAEDGAPFTPEAVPLHWRGHPLPDCPDDIVFELVRPDGTVAPGTLLRLSGTPALALAGNEVFLIPPPLPGHEPRSVIIPREALATPAAAKALHRAAARVEGVELPKVEIIPLRPRFVCRLVQDSGDPWGRPGEWLHVELWAATPDDTLLQRRNHNGRWVTQRGTATSGDVIREIDHRRADATVPLLHEFQLGQDYEKPVWMRSAGAKNFPDQFAAWAERCRGLGVEFECDPELAGLVRPADRARVDVSVKSDDEGSGIDWFDLEIAVRAEDSTLTDAEMKLLLKAKGRFVRLPGKGWRRLSLALSDEETAKLAEFGLDATALEGGSEKQRFHALQLADERIAGLLPEQHAARARERANRLAAIAEPPIPAGLTAELRPYQKEGFHFLAHLSANGLGGVLADDMGLGKTVQALTWLLHLTAQRPAKGKKAAPVRALVVCPKSVVPNWTIETKKFAPSLTAVPLAGATVAADANLVVANYAQLRRAAKELGAVKWDAVILDEGQNIKNPQSQTARVARDLRTTHRIVLTGTPIENRTLDLWSLFAFAMPGLLGSQASFKRAFNDKTDPGAARARLARRVKHFMLRRTKGQVAADLPPRTEEDLFVELDGAQRRLYDAELKRTRALLLGVQTGRDFDQQRFNILQSLLRLRQICCDPRLVGFEDAKAGRARAKKAAAKPAAGGDSGEEAANGDSGSAKLEALLDTIEPLVEEGHRVLVFSQFVTMLELIASELAVRGIPHLTLTGQTENRQDLVNRFQSPEGEPVFLLSLKAAGAGLNLTAASYVVLFDPWWNPAVEAQAIDRTHRIGQTEHVIAYRLIARGTIEEKIRKLQQAKADLARSIVQEETLSTVMSLDDLRFILSEDPAE